MQNKVDICEFIFKWSIEKCALLFSPLLKVWTKVMLKLWRKKTSQSPCQLSRYEYISNGGDKQTHKSTIIWVVTGDYLLSSVGINNKGVPCCFFFFSLPWLVEIHMFELRFEFSYKLIWYFTININRKYSIDAAMIVILSNHP